ncbi:hypothetical protein BJ170DRAFT_346112 [Xylariales sp. AK1849]|nr:hypothetical protein BJ170DRAFT_346112 [Xylariales sp. AK1849]
MEQQNLREVARSSWTEARKIRQTILQKIKDLRDSLEDRQGSNVNLTARLEGIENLMKELRLASMAVIFYDFEYADEKDVEAQLWQAHVVFNGEYRQIAVRQNQVVLKRKVDKLYRDFLKTSQFFYRGYIQRLSGRFWIPELQHAARGLDIEPLETPQRDHTPPATLREKLVKSCYLTLIRLGDLARYRCQMNDKPPKASFDIALTYYGLANTLDVDDGSSYHQTALLYQPSAQHLEIIYYFHRSVCVAKPHKFGVGNLERAFKSFLDNQSGPRPGARNSSTDDASEALTKWFLRLHAHYSQGVVFSAREELEKEVLHRFRLYLRVEGNEDLALKLLLINIAAGDIAFENVKDSSNWTIERSRSCQHLLTFNIRVAVVLFRLFKSALQDNASTATVKFQENHAESKVEFSPSVQKLLRLTRICIAWIYAVRLNLIQYQEWLEPQIRELYCLLADTLTLLLPYILWDEEVVESKYLLPEDTEAGGLRILSHRKLPLFQDVQIIPGYTPPKVRRAVKPRKEALGLAYSPHTESVWRIRDIVCCGIYLAGSGKSPLTIVTTTDGEINKWVYNQDGNIQIHLDEAVMTRTFAQLKMSALRVPGEEDDLVDLNAADPNYPMSRTPGNHQRTLPEHLARQTAMAQAAAEARQISQPAHLNFAGQSTKTTEDGYNRGQDMSIDSDMIDMVNKLIDSDDDEDDTRPVSSKVTADTSYGMDSSAANDIFGGFMASPHVSTGDPATNVPPTVFSSGKTIPNLPWNYFYSPSTSNGPDISYADANGYNVPRTVGAQNQGVATATSYTGQLASPIRGSYDQNFSPGAFGRSMDSNSNGVSNTRATPRSSAENRRPSGTTPGTTVSSPKALDTVKGSDYPTSQQNSALDNLRAALYAQMTLSPLCKVTAAERPVPSSSRTSEDPQARPRRKTLETARLRT